MIKRIVKMTFIDSKVDTFMEIFEQSQDYIRSQDGCKHLELWQSTEVDNVFFTFSIWTSEELLNQYRKSELFGQVWPATKKLFSKKAEAWSVIVKEV